MVAVRFSEGKRRKKKRTRNLRAEGKFPSAPSLLRSCYIDRLDRTGARQFHTIAKRSRCNASSHLRRFPPFLFIYYLETAARFMQTRKLDRVPGKIVSDRKWKRFTFLSLSTFRIRSARFLEFRACSRKVFSSFWKKGNTNFSSSFFFFNR